jgi:putative ABC transport system permease protein
MKFFATIRIAIRAIRRNTMRSVLTALGIIIGVGAVIAMVGVGNGAKAQVEAQVASLGQNLIMVWAGNFSSGGVRSGWGGAGTLMLDDAKSIATEVPGVVAVSAEVRTGAQIVSGNQNWYTTVVGEDATYFDMREWPLALGATFTDQDVRNANKVAIIGQTVATQLFGVDNPVGQVIRVRQVPFVVVGVLTPKGLSVQGTDQDDVIVAPYTSVMKRLLRTTNLRTINIQAASQDLQLPVQRQVETLLREHHHITGGKLDDFTVHNQEEIAQMATATTSIMTLLLGAIASVSLVVGGIGIMNIMLVSVTERTREIGIRMAVGAHARDILLQFLIEAITLSSMGGILGILIGVGTAKALSYFAGWPTLVSISSIVIAFLFSAAVGVFFGFYPARKASQLDPIDALRYE